MGRLLLKIAAPVVGVGALFGAGFSARKFGFIEVGTWAWLWPLLVAVALLALAVFVLLKGARRWLWPLITGFVSGQALESVAPALLDHLLTKRRESLVVQILGLQPVPGVIHQQWWKRPGSLDAEADRPLRVCLVEGLGNQLDAGMVQWRHAKLTGNERGFPVAPGVDRSSNRRAWL